MRTKLFLLALYTLFLSMPAWSAVTVTGVSSSTTNGTYSVGEAINVTVTFSESVTFTKGTGMAKIELETGTTDHFATCTTNSVGETLTFVYMPYKGDASADLDYKATDSLTLTGTAAIKDTATGLVDATLTLASPGGAGSLGDAKALVVDTEAYTLIQTQPASLTVNKGQLATFTVVPLEGTSPTYQWCVDPRGSAKIAEDSLNCTDISGATSASYTIGNTEVENQGTYRCVVTDTYGEYTSNTATLSVLDPTYSNCKVTVDTATGYAYVELRFVTDLEGRVTIDSRQVLPGTLCAYSSGVSCNAGTLTFVPYIYVKGIVGSVTYSGTRVELTCGDAPIISLTASSGYPLTVLNIYDDIEIMGTPVLFKITNGLDISNNPGEGLIYLVYKL